MAGEGQQEGYEWEKRFCSRIGARLQPGSGNAFYARLDGVGKMGLTILWSLKSTIATERKPKASLTITKGIIEEAISAAQGPGGVGADALIGIAANVDGYEVVAFLADDILMLLSEDVKVVPATKDESRRRRARTPSLLRE